MNLKYSLSGFERVSVAPTCKLSSLHVVQQQPDHTFSLLQVAVSIPKAAVFEGAI